ncbi:MAG: hypothetical protein LBO00_06180 [Zoogloeaceae bacterium]|jgi:hypothetical protein|nr:hypothetical protein [Zoogloeaceae bacterium]
MLLPLAQGIALFWSVQMKSFLMVLINLEAVLVCALLNNWLSSCGLYEVTILSFVFALQSILSALAALVFWFGLKNQESAGFFTLLNALSVAGCVAGAMPFRLGCVV